MSTRMIDYRGEKALALFLDEYFYPKLIEAKYFDSFQREYTVTEQKRGIDLLGTYGKNVVRIDEKAQLHYIGNPRNTFIMELDYYDSEKLCKIDGWFLSKSNVTDLYLLIWIHDAKTDKLHRIVSEDFLELEVAFLSKRKIKEYLHRKGYTEQKLRMLCDSIRSGLTRVDQYKSDRFHFSFSTQLAEQPINIVLEKNLIDELALKRFFVNKMRVEERG